MACLRQLTCIDEFQPHRRFHGVWPQLQGGTAVLMPKAIDEYPLGPLVNLGSRLYLMTSNGLLGGETVRFESPPASAQGAVSFRAHAAFSLLLSRNSSLESNARVAD
jgi:hypothetical protein